MAPRCKVYREVGKHEIGLVVNIEPKYPASDSPEDLAATRRAEAYMNRQYLDPAFFGTYPEELREIFGEAWPEWPQEDMDLIRQPLDFIGVNYYTRNVSRHDEPNWPLKVAPVRQKQHTYTETGWEVFPQGLTDTLVWVKERYGNPESLHHRERRGLLRSAQGRERGRVRDPLRLSYLRQHLRAVHAAIEAGCDIGGYFVWSLLDNLEWSLGYSKRFGIVHVDFETQTRTPKDSARYYAKVVASHGTALTNEDD